MVCWCSPGEAARLVAATFLAALLVAVPARAANDPPKPEMKLAPGAAEAPAPAAGETPSPAAADPTACEGVKITVANRSGRPLKFVSIDHQTARRWVRGDIVFKTVADGADYTWTGSLAETAGQPVRFRINTRSVVDAATDSYGDLDSRTIATKACASGETHRVEIGRPGS